MITSVTPLLPTKWPVTSVFFNLMYYGQDNNLVNNGSITKNQCRIIKLKERWASYRPKFVN